MFSNATAFNGDISSWDVSQVTTMSYMFQGAKAFNSDVSGWDVNQVRVSTDYDSGANDWQSVNKPQF